MNDLDIPLNGDETFTFAGLPIDNAHDDPFTQALKSAYHHLKAETESYAASEPTDAIRQMRLRFLQISTWTLQHIVTAYQDDTLNQASVVLFLQMLTTERDLLPRWLKERRPEQLAAMPWWRKNSKHPEISGRINDQEPTAAWHAQVDAVRVCYEAGSVPNNVHTAPIWRNLLAFKQAMVEKQCDAYAGVKMVHLLPLIDWALNKVSHAPNATEARKRIREIFKGLTKPRVPFTRETNAIETHLLACLSACNLDNLWGTRNWAEQAYHLNAHTREPHGHHDITIPPPPKPIFTTPITGEKAGPFGTAITLWREMLQSMSQTELKRLSVSAGATWVNRRYAELEQLAALPQALHNALTAINTDVITAQYPPNSSDSLGDALSQPVLNPGITEDAFAFFQSNLTARLCQWALREENRYLSTEALIQSAQAAVDSAMSLVQGKRSINHIYSST